MRFNLSLITIALVLLVVGTGTVAADDVDGEQGVCVDGADSPCIDRETTAAVSSDDSPDDPIQYHPDELAYASGFASEEAPADGREVSDGLPLAPGFTGDVGVCVVGADSPCNGAGVGFGSGSDDGVVAECIGNETHTCEGTAWDDPDAVVVHPVDDQGRSFPSQTDGGYVPYVPEPQLDDTVRCVTAPCESPESAVGGQQTVRGIGVDAIQRVALEASPTAPFDRFSAVSLFVRLSSVLSIFG